MTDLLKNAQSKDKEAGLDQKSIQDKENNLKDYKRKLAKANALMIRTEDNPPSEMDVRHLDNVLWKFRKDKETEGSRL